MRLKNDMLFIDIRFLIVDDDFFDTTDYTQINQLEIKLPNIEKEEYKNLFIEDLDFYKMLWEVNLSEILRKSKEKSFYLYFKSYPPTKDVFLLQTGFYLSEVNFESICKEIPEFFEFYSANSLKGIDKSLGIYNGFKTYLLNETTINRLKSFCNKNQFDDDFNLSSFCKYILNESRNILIQKIS